MGYSFTIFGVSFLALLLAGYLAQHYLPPPKPKVVGIDLGTTYSCIAVYEAVTGIVRVVPNSQEQETIPSIVAFGENGAVLVGHEALAQVEKNPVNTIYDAKRFIGKKFKKEELLKEAAGYQFKIVEHGGLAQFMLNHNGNLTLVKPEEIGAHIIRSLRLTAEANLSIPVTRAVMAVPAEFNELQRNFTKLAAKFAGVEVLRLINEPTAAALAYGLHKKDNVRNVVVIDVGGGTSDISLLNIQGGMFSTQSMAGNNHLGGQDFNQRLYNYIYSIILTKYQKNTLSAEDLQTLRLAIENAKLQISTKPYYEMSVALSSIQPTVETVFQYNLTRTKFEEINEDLFKKVLLLLDAVLKPVELHPSDVDEVVLVGGSTRIPRIRQLIKQYFGKSPNVGIDPELAVAYGVAIQAGIIGGMWPLQVSAIEIPTRLKKIQIN